MSMPRTEFSPKILHMEQGSVASLVPALPMSMLDIWVDGDGARAVSSSVVHGVSSLMRMHLTRVRDGGNMTT